MLTKTQKSKKGPLSHRKKSSFLDYIQLLMMAKQSEQKTLTEMQKNEKGLLSHRKIKCFFYNYIQLLMIGRAIWAKNVDQNTKKWKRPQKIKCSKISIWEKMSKIKCSFKNFHFWITFNFSWLAHDLSKKHWPKCKKMKKAP